MYYLKIIELVWRIEDIAALKECLTLFRDVLRY